MYITIFKPQWIPNAPSDKPKKEQKTGFSLLSGFAAGPSVKEVINENLKKADKTDENFEKFPGFNIMQSYSTHDLTKKMPDPKRCIIEIIKIQLKVFQKYLKYLITNTKTKFIFSQM